MSQTNQLEWATGLYQHDNENNFVVSNYGNELYLKINKDKQEKLSASGDGLYQLDNTNIKVKFHRLDGGIANSITLYFPDKQVVASRQILISKDQSFFSKVKELTVFIVLFIILAAVSPLIYRPIKSNCLSHGSQISCTIANLMAPIYSNKAEIEAIHNQLSKFKYSETRADVLQGCSDGDQNSCIEVAKQKFQIGAKEQAYTLLKRGCFKFKHGLSCQQWYNFLISNSQVELANKIIFQACQKDVALACHEYGWKMKKSKKTDYVKFFDKACGLGEPESCYELGKYHLQFNRSRSYDYYKRACLGYHRRACDMRDKIEAYFDAKNNCLKKDDAHACFLMASFEFDYGDQEKSIQFYKMACDKGSAHACSFLKRNKTFNQFQKENKKDLDTI